MAKQTGQQKAKGIVNKALGTFTKAIDEIKKANELLETEVAKDEQEMADVTKSIENKYTRLEYIQSEKINKVAEIRSNKDLIAKLEKFTK